MTWIETSDRDPRADHAHTSKEGKEVKYDTCMGLQGALCESWLLLQGGWLEGVRAEQEREVDHPRDNTD